MMYGRPGRQDVFERFEHVGMANHVKCETETTDKSLGLTNPKSQQLVKKNPGALAGASEVKHFEKASQLPPNYTAIYSPCASLAVRNA